MTELCFICGESLEGYTVRTITVLGELQVDACAPCVHLPDTAEFVRRLIVERLLLAHPSGQSRSDRSPSASADRDDDPVVSIPSGTAGESPRKEQG